MSGDASITERWNRDQVNLKRPMTVDDQFDGHVVKGTVDTVTDVVGVERLGEERVVTFAVPESCAQYLVGDAASRPQVS